MLISIKVVPLGEAVIVAMGTVFARVIVLPKFRCPLMFGLKSNAQTIYLFKVKIEQYRRH